MDKAVISHHFSQMYHTDLPTCVKLLFKNGVKEREQGSRVAISSSTAELLSTVSVELCLLKQPVQQEREWMKQGFPMVAFPESHAQIIHY